MSAYHDYKPVKRTVRRVVALITPFYSYRGRIRKRIREKLSNIEHRNL